jgi:bifunctional DNA-binding transcriptional regulator/antitoxin component of YhaV-PrlF toxin-antitoxin module
MVIPKALRDELGIHGPTEVDVEEYSGELRMSVPPIPAHVEMRDGLAVIVPEVPMKPMTAEDVRAALERVRR